MKIVVGHKILNLQELYNISCTPGTEVVIDSQIKVDIGNTVGKEAAPVTEYPSQEPTSQMNFRAMVAVKFIQVLKLKGQAQHSTVDALLSILNTTNPEKELSFFETIYKYFADNKVYPNDKERFVLNHVPTLRYAQHALLTFQARELSGFMIAALAFHMETLEFPIDYFTEYSLSQGRSSQGIVLFKNGMLSMVEKSKKLATKPELNDKQKESWQNDSFSKYSQIVEKSMVNCPQLQNEINCDSGAIFANKKYKELIKIAVAEQEKQMKFIDDKYNLTQSDEAKFDHEYLLSIVNMVIEDFNTNNAKELELVAKAEQQKKDAEEAAKAEEEKPDDGKKKKKAKKVKEIATKIAFGKGTRAFFEFLQIMRQESQDDEEFLNKVNPLINKEMSTVLQEILESTNENARKPKCAKGTRDMTPLQMAIREIAFNKIRNVFKKHGASEIDTPVFELKETLTSKYGEESKLIYDLEDQGGELLSLRYDLTVPFARYVAERGLSSIKRFHIAKVYRRDTPQMNKGRFREFYQCDFDIAGSYGLMIPDADLLCVIVDILKSLEIGSFQIKLNHRTFLDAMVHLAGCEKRKFKAICSSIDKLDKEPWSAVKEELITQKGLTEEMCAKLETFVQYKGSPWEMLQRLKDDKVFAGHKEGEQTIKDMEVLFSYLDAMKIIDNISFDFSLARGLDYYTGVIYEAVLTDQDRVGSISGGGRYDGLIGMFSGKVVPSVGGSIGIERIFNILEEKMLAKGKVRATETQVLVSQMGKNLTAKRMETLALLWDADVKAETLYVDNPRTDKTFNYAFDNGIPLILILGEQEMADGIYKIKSLNENKEYEVKKDQLIERVRELIAANPVLLPKPEADKKEEEKQS